MANSRLRFVNVPHDQIAAHAADGMPPTGRALGGDQPSQPSSPMPPPASPTRRSTAPQMVVIAGRAVLLLRQAPAPGSELHADTPVLRDLPAFVMRAWRVDTRSCFPRSSRRHSSSRVRPAARAGQRADGRFSSKIDVALFDGPARQHQGVAKPSLDVRDGASIVSRLLEDEHPIVYARRGGARPGYDELRAFASNCRFAGA